jgi:heme exporter protein A
MISAHSLTKLYGHHRVLRGLNLDVAEGEFVALLGPNGTGKTTLLRLISGLTRPNFGYVTVGGHRLPEAAHTARAMLGVVSHQPLLYTDLSAEENLRFYAQMYGLKNPAPRIDAVLEQVGLRARRRDPVRAFSRGMMQRLAIARAILHEPQIMLFDEPHTGLDPDASAMLDGLLTDVAARGRTVLMTTHDLGRALTLASRLIILAHGQVAHTAPTEGKTLMELHTLYEQVTRVK